MSFQIIESNRSLPSQGPNVHGNVSTDTGAGMTARAYGGLGTGLANLGEGLFIAQGQAELTQKMAEAKEKISKMYLDLEKETDPERYDQVFQETWSEIEGSEVKNGWASREWKLRLPDLKARQEEVIGLAKREQVRENHTIALANAEAEATRTGNMKVYETLLQKQVAEKWISEDAAELKRNEVRHKSSQQAMSSFAYQSPESVLAWKSAEDMQKVYKYALPTDLTWIQGVAQNVLRDREYRRGKLQEQQIQEIHAKASQAIPPSPKDMADFIHGKTNLSPAQQTKAMEEFNKALGIWHKTDQNPYMTTTDYAYFEQMKWDAIDGKMTEQKIRAAIPDKISSPAGDELRRIMKEGPTAKDFEDSSAAKYLKEMIDLPGIIQNKKPILREKGYRLLQDAIKKSPTPMTDREKKEAALRIYYNLKAESLITPEEASAILTEEEKRERVGRRPEDVPLGVTLGLQEIWGKLDDASKRAALDLLSKGATPEQLIAHFKRKMGK